MVSRMPPTSISLNRRSSKKVISKFSWNTFASQCLHNIIMFIVCIVAVCLSIALVTYNTSDPSWNTITFTDNPMHNKMGSLGAIISDILFQSFGIASFLIPLFLFIWLYRLWCHEIISPLGLRFVTLCCSIILISMPCSALPNFSWLPQDHAGGIIGESFLNFLSIPLQNLIGFSPSLLVGIAMLCFGLWFFNVSIALKPDERRVLMSHMLKGGAMTMAGANSIWQRFIPRRSEEIENHYQIREHIESVDEDEEYENEEYEDDSSREISVIKRHEPKASSKSKKSSQTKLDLREPSEWELPSVEFLQIPIKQGAENLDESALRKNADMLQNVLSDYNVSGDITSIHPGPVVTLYELEPSPGTKTSRVVGLSDDIARSMSAISVRVAVVPGRNVIGIELPNKKRQTVYLRDLLEGSEFDDTAAKLPLVLGKDIGGQPIIADLARMPHLLVAGTTGSGKSVAVNTMILSLLYKLPPEKCRFIMIDPKMLELSVYDDIPHLLAPVVTEPGRAIVALKWTVQEMENRYRNMSKLGVRNIEGYNARLKEARKKGEILMRKVQTGFDADTGKPVFEEQPLDLNEIPYIVVIVDEFADLMLVAGKDVENAIQRLAQMARAAGIHLIMATQRPSVDVITGVIKANFPTRISFQVTSKIDSRTILGEGGAETLLGMGDMLYMAAGGRITRVHGPFVSDKEVEDVVNFLKSQGEPEYLEEVTDGDLFGEQGGSDDAPPSDELYDKAVALIAEEGKASTSFIQRHFQIGYNRAARIIEEMEKNGVVGKANHVGKREVLVGEHRRY
jgi:S-DNA-T family DNA segregation ATPase FtsK/SpoIIIE